MELPRRGFLKTSALTAVSAGIALGGTHLAFAQRPGSPRGIAIPHAAEESPLFSFTLETFEPYVGDIFTAPNARGQLVALKLIDARKFQVRAAKPMFVKNAIELRSFSLTFRSQERLPKFTSIHKMSHPALGEFDLFLTPREQEDGSFTYEAVFSHI